VPMAKKKEDLKKEYTHDDILNWVKSRQGQGPQPIKILSYRGEDGKELSIAKIKDYFENEEYDEIRLFGISDKLYNSLIEYLNEIGLKYTIDGRSRIQIKRIKQ